jgi:uncharacterized protein
MSVFSYIKNNPLIIASATISVAIVLCTVIAAYTTFLIKASENVIQVTGSARVRVTADLGKWTLTLDSKTGLTDQQKGYDTIEKATEKIVTYLNEQGFTDIETPAPGSSANFYYPQNAEPIQTGYTVARMIIVKSTDVQKLSDITSKVDPLGGFGYNVTSNGLELTYQKLPETRVALLSEAIKDAKARAEAVAKESDRKVGRLQSSTGGVVQVLPAGGVDVSDSGTYDTQSMNKEVMVTVRATFGLD